MMYGGKNANKGRNNRYVWVECCGPLHPDGPVRSGQENIIVLDKLCLSNFIETLNLLKHKFTIIH